MPEQPSTQTLADFGAAILDHVRVKRLDEITASQAKKMIVSAAAQAGILDKASLFEASETLGCRLSSLRRHLDALEEEDPDKDADWCKAQVTSHLKRALADSSFPRIYQGKWELLVQSPKTRIYLAELLTSNQIPVDGGRNRAIMRFHPRDLIHLAFLVGMDNEAGDLETFIQKINLLNNETTDTSDLDETKKVMRFFSEPFVASLGTDAIKQVIGCTIRHELPALIESIHEWLGSR